MENKNQQFRGFGIIEDAHVQVKLNELQLFLKFDSKEQIYQLKFLTKNTVIANFISSNLNFFLELRTSNMQSLFTHDYIDRPHTDILSFIQRTFVMGMRDYIGYPGALVDQDVSVQRDILCYCAKLSKKSFSFQFVQNRGDAKKTIFDTLAKSFCDTCSFEVDKLIKELEAKNEYFLGEDKSIWIDKIDALIEEFYLFCPPEYNNLKFEVSALKYNKIIIKCDKQGSSLKRLEIQSTLSNYLLDEIKEDVVISIIT